MSQSPSPSFIFELFREVEEALITSGTYAQAYTTRTHLEVQYHGMACSGLVWSGAEWNGEVEWSAVEWRGVEWRGTGVGGSGVE